MKQCSMCKQDLPLSEYNRKGNSLQPLCKECNRQRSRAYYERNRESHSKATVERNRQQRERNREYVRNIKESNPCVDCGSFHPYYVMDFDHLGNKRDNISRMIASGTSLDTISIEIAKCELVCANCHRYRTFKYLG